MAYCTLDILQLASGIYQSLGSPPSQSVGFISGVLTSSGQLGDLNNKLSICLYLTGDGPCIEGMGPDEAAVYALSYKADYYETRATSILDGGGTFWTEMSEGDTRIRRDSANNTAKVFLSMSENGTKALRLAIQDYKRARANPASVDGSSLYSYPSP